MMQTVRHHVAHSPDHPHTVWLLHSLYARETTLPRGDYVKLFEDTDQLVTGYDLTHALLCYRFLQQKAPGVAEERHVAERMAEIIPRLMRHQAWDARPGDIYNERVAFLLDIPDGPEIPARWIERIILSQNTDGGWRFRSDTVRLLGQMVGRRGDARGNPHATFLALFALTQYREVLREEGFYPP
jgi:hypothetical protein